MIPVRIPLIRIRTTAIIDISVGEPEPPRAATFLAPRADFFCVRAGSRSRTF